MEKRQLLVTILQKLSPYRDQAEGFLAFVESESCSDASVENVLREIQKTIDEINNRAFIHNKQIQSQSFVEQQEKDIQEAQNLLSQFTQ